MAYSILVASFLSGEGERMPPSGNSSLLDALKTFARDLKASYGSLVAQQEDQLKEPTGEVLKKFGSEFGLDVLPRFEPAFP